MAPIDRRLRLWAWMVRRQGSIATRSEAEVIALQARHVPDNALTNRIFGTVSPGTVVKDRTIPGPGGDLPVRVYRPVRPNSGARPLVVYFHGGGFVFGDLRLGDWLCSSVAVTVGAVVVSVDYRLAPRHRFPAAGGERQRAVHPPAGDARLPQALPRRRRSRRSPGVAPARRGPQRPAPGADPGGRARPAARRRSPLRRGPASRRGAGAVHRVCRHAARFPQLPRRVPERAAGAGRTVRGAEGGARRTSPREGAQRVNLSSHLIQRLLRLDPPQTRDLVTERDLRVPMPDGAVLLADRYAPRGADPSLPTALIRSPYGRRGLIAAGIARPLAERGFQVLMQSTRGTFGSGGVLDPFRHEREDGLATLEWVVKQPWFGGTIVLAGGSYLGYVQWAVADSLPPEVKAMIPQVTESALTLEFLRKDGLSLETPFSWGVMVAGQERRLGMLRGMAHARKNRRALSTLPLGEADVAAIGRHSDYVQDVLACDADQPRWAGIDHRHRVAQVSVPVCSIGGWYDIFLPGQLRDFKVLQEAGRPARLTVGPWTHIALDGTALQESIAFGLAHARGEPPPPRAPVRLYVMGEEAWRDFDAWPPPGYPSRRFHLQPGGALAGPPPGGEPPGEPSDREPEPSRYRYDPANPTPAVGGVRMTRKNS